MTRMQNRLTSRAPCGDQGCSDKPTDADIRHRARREEERETRKAEQEARDARALEHAAQHRWTAEERASLPVIRLEDFL